MTLKTHLVRPYPRDLQIARWNKLAPKIGFRPSALHLGVSCSSDLMHEVFDHGAIVAKESGQLALLGDPYRRAQDDDKLYAFADRFGLQVDYLGRGLWLPGKSRLVVFSVVDPVRALSLIQSRFRQGMPEREYVVYGHPRRFMPPGTNMATVRRMHEDLLRQKAIEDARRFQKRFALTLLSTPQSSPRAQSQNSSEAGR